VRVGSAMPVHLFHTHRNASLAKTRYDLGRVQRNDKAANTKLSRTAQELRLTKKKMVPSVQIEMFVQAAELLRDLPPAKRPKSIAPEDDVIAREHD
jgi:hypothetical protein